MNTEHTISTAAEEQDISPKISDQNFEENSAKLMNYEDSNFTLDHDNESTIIEDNLNVKLRRKGQYKHMMNNHDLKSILPGKRSRKPVDPSAEGSKGNHSLPVHNLKRESSEPHQKSNMNLRHASKKQVKAQMKADTKLNNIFRKAPNMEETSEIVVDTKEVFENYYQRLKRRNDFSSHDTMEKILPEKRRFIEVMSPYVNKSEIEAIPTNLEHSNEDVSFLANRNLFQKNRDFQSIKMLDKTVLNFPKAIPVIVNPQAQIEKLDEIRKKLEAVPKKTFKKHEKRAAIGTEEHIDKDGKAVTLTHGHKHPHTFINCDLRYFNFDFLVDKIGSFDVILMDPPWRIKGQQNDSSFMFSNSKFSLEYDTMSNQEIMNLRVDKLSKKGFIFLWILSNQLNTAYEMLNKWGYEVVDQIIWVKLRDQKVFLSQGYYLMHSFEMCLLGYKCPPGEYVEYNSKVSNNIIFADVRKKSQKPDELYEIIDLMMPGAKKIELFARNHNLRQGWFSLGNQLGEEFNKWYNLIGCNSCNNPISIGIKRYKARRQANYDLCEKCFQNMNLNKDDFFEMNNQVDEDVLHHYHSCNKCLAEPIWGTRFTCMDCENFDLCEGCYDSNLQSAVKFHDINHNFHPIEVPFLASGLPAHCDKKCTGCFQKPIIGVCFSCVQCPNLHFCQNCYFTKSPEDMKKYRGHKPFHNFSILAEPVELENKPYKCYGCDVSPIQGTPYKCENCFNFYFCEKCYFKRDSFKSNNAHSHKFYHTFMALPAIE